MHQGFLSNREGGQGVTGADESTKNPHGGTVHRGGGQSEMRLSRWVLMGKEWLRGMEEDTHPDPARRRGGWCGVEAGRRELALGGYGGEKRTAHGLIERKNKTMGGSVWATPHGGRGRTGLGIPTAARERWRLASVGQCPAPCGSRGAGGTRGLHASVWAARERVVRPGKKRPRSGLREQCRLGFKTNFRTEHDLIQSKTNFILIKKFK
jgi:hypothetical protein